MTENRVEAVERALSVLDAFHEGDDALTLAALAARTGLYKSTILRLAGSLERFGYVRRTPDGNFRLGPSLWRLGSLYRHNFDLGEHVRPELRHLVNVTRESASFFVRDGDDRLCLYRLDSPRPIRHHVDEGARLPLDRGAAGRVLLAFDGTIGEPFETIRKQGYCVSLGERDPEVAAAAVPVVDAKGSVRGALAVSALITRFDEAARVRVLAELRKSAENLKSTLPTE